MLSMAHSLEQHAESKNMTITQKYDVFTQKKFFIMQQFYPASSLQIYARQHNKAIRNSLQT